LMLNQKPSSATRAEGFWLFSPLMPGG
jgi:hypothetical protein